MLIKEYSGLQPLKKFQVFDYRNAPDVKSAGPNFYDQHVVGELVDSKPNYNPLEHIVFADTKRQYEMYSLSSVLHIKRGFLVKQELLEFLKEYTLAEHCIYHGIKREFEGKIYDDLIFIYFYRDYSLKIDYANSDYWLLRDGYHSRDRTKETMNDYLVEDNIQIESLEDWNVKKKDYYNKSDKKHLLLVKNLKCPAVIDYDLFGFQGFDSGLYVSERLRAGLENRKTKGLDFRGNIYFNFKS